MVQRYHPVFMNTHFNHPDELTPAAVAALDRLSRAGVPLGCQTVLLKGVNDDPVVMKELMHRLLKARVRPYYIYMCDPVAGGEHFRTTVEKGLEIISALRGWTSGLAVPHFVIDAPGGGGKVPLLPEYVESISDDEVVLRNYEGRRFVYKQPAGTRGFAGLGGKKPKTESRKSKSKVEHGNSKGDGNGKNGLRRCGLINRRRCAAECSRGAADCGLTLIRPAIIREIAVRSSAGAVCLWR